MASVAAAGPVRAPEPGNTSTARRFLTFRIDGRRYALPAGDVAEVMPIPVVARLPLAPKSLMGLANLRGMVIPVVDPRILLRREAFVAGRTARAVVVDGRHRWPWRSMPWTR